MTDSLPTPILFIHHRSELGGAPTSLAYVLRELDREQYDPHVFCPPGPAADLFRSAGATVYTGRVASFTHIWASVYQGRRWLLLLRELLYLVPHLMQLRALLRRQRFAIVHLNDAPLLPAAILVRLHGTPIVSHLRSSLPYGGQDRRSRYIRRVLRWAASASIAINDDVASSYALGSDVVPNAVELDRFRPSDRAEARQQIGIAPTERLVTFFGFLYPSKGFSEFIKAAAELKAAGVKAHYMMVGGAVRSEAYFRTPVGRAVRFLDLARDYESLAHELVRSLGLEGDITFVPFTLTLSTIYQASDVVVAPSRGPELGRPVIEAAASGVPVVATGSRGGAGILLPERTGILAADMLPSTLAAAIGSLLADDERRAAYGAAARAHAEAHFDAAVNTRRIEQIYRRLVVPARSGRTPILYVHHRPQLGGAPSSLAYLIANLDPRFEPHVFVPAGPAAELFASVGATVHTGKVAIFAHSWDRPYRGLLWLLATRELLSLPRHLIQLNALMRRHRFPIVHLNDSPLLPAAAVAHRRGAQVVWHLRSALAGEGRDGRSRAILALMDRWGDTAIAIDSDVAARFPTTLPVRIVHNSFHLRDETTGDNRAGRARLGLPEEGRILIGFAGFLRRQKGWPELVAAARILVDKGAPVHFVIMGGGVRSPEWFRTPRGKLLTLTGILSNEESALTELVTASGLQERFTFLPFVRDTAEVYEALDIVTFPNQGVGLGRPVLEAAAHGRPVVASGSSDGADVLLPDVTGLLLEHGSPVEIAAALQTLVTDGALRERFGQAAQAHARTAFDPVLNARRVEAVYDELLAGTIAAPAGPPHQLLKTSDGATNG